MIPAISPPTRRIFPRNWCALDRKVAELRGVVRTAAARPDHYHGRIVFFMYRQTKLLRYQIIARSEMVAQAEASVAPELQLVPRFQQVGGLHPDYASNVLAHFGSWRCRPPTPRPRPSLGGFSRRGPCGSGSRDQASATVRKKIRRRRIHPGAGHAGLMRPEMAPMDHQVSQVGIQLNALAKMKTEFFAEKMA